MGVQTAQTDPKPVARETLWILTYPEALKLGFTPEQIEIPNDGQDYLVTECDGVIRIWPTR